MGKIIYKDLSFIINGLFYKVHQELGKYKNEKQYADLFEKFLNKNNLNYVREYRFKNKQFGKEEIRCVCDFIIDDKIVLEFKSKNYIDKEDYYQLKRYLTSLNLRLGVLVNFRQDRLVPKRVLNSAYYNNN